MRCPHCGKEENIVMRTEKFDTVYRRYRKCHACNFSFSTYETIDTRCYDVARALLKDTGGAVAHVDENEVALGIEAPEIEHDEVKGAKKRVDKSKAIK